MLETIREFCLGRLEQVGEMAETKARHAVWCMDLAERIEPELIGPAQDRWCAVFDHEHGNLRAALSWAIAQHDATTALRLSGALWRYWQFRGFYDEGRRWIERALAIDDRAGTTARAKACRGGARLAFRQGDLDRADALNQEALAIERERGNHAGIAASLGGLGLVAHDRGDFRRAADLYEAALTIYQALNDHAGVGRTLNSLGALACNQGDYQRSAALHESALAIRRAAGDQDGIAYSLCNLAYLAYVDGNLSRAAALFQEGLTLFQQVGNQARLIESLEEFALIAMARGQAVQTVRLHAAAETLRDRIGVPVPPTAVHRADLERDHDAAWRQLGPDAFTGAWEEGRQMTLDQALTYALHANPP
jgi:tetratricopeptide (TPR) repeat protein